MGTLFVIYFQHIQDKRDAMRFKYLLKGVAGYGGKPMFINDYVPAATQEKRRQEQQLLKTNEERDEDNRLDIKYVRGKLTVQNEAFKPKITAPTPRQLVDIDPQDLAEILRMELDSGGVIQQDKSIFEGFTASVSTIAQIRRLYIKVKLMQPTARHVVYAYYLPGEYLQYQLGSCDDEEPGAAKAILSILEKNNMKNRVVFISRKYGGIRLGSDRFECYKQAAKTVLMANPHNTVLDIDQTITQEDTQTRSDNYVQRKSTTREQNSEESEPRHTAADVSQHQQKPQQPHPQRGSQPLRNSRRRYAGNGYGRGNRRGRYFHHDYSRTPPPKYSNYRQAGSNLVYERRHTDQGSNFTDSHSWTYSNDDWGGSEDRRFYDRRYVHDRDSQLD